MTDENKSYDRIFEYEMAGKKKYGDPLVINKRIGKSLGADDFNTIWKGALLEAKEGEVLSQPAKELKSMNEDRIIEIARAAFNAPPIDEDTGLVVSEREVFAALLSFMNFMSDVKKNTETLPNSAESTQDTSSPSAETESPESKKLDCG